MKIGIGQINTRIGDFEGNILKIRQICQKLAGLGAELAVFPECAVSGYPLKDLVFYDKFVDAAQDALHSLASSIPIPAIVGCPRKCEGAVGYRNSAYWLESGTVRAMYDKHLLPNYGALNDARNFDSGDGFCVVDFKGKKIGLTVCEDIWTLSDVSTSLRYENMLKPMDYYASLNASGNAGLDLLVNISASVFSSSNDSVRKRGGLLEKVSAKVKSPLIWCNLVGGADDIIFAGGSAYVDAEKCVCKCLKKFEEDCLVVDTDAEKGYDGDAYDYQGIGDLRKALVLALRDFIQKCGLKRVLIGLSGGIDSALVAALAVEALGAENVIGVSMPSKISSAHSVADAKALAENLGIEFHIVPIADTVETVEETLSPLFSGKERDVTEENIQSRARGLILMAISNKFGALVLTTGNKSECSVGYCTLYGDTCGGFAPICDVYKTDVYKLCNYINTSAGREIIPQNTIDKPPSAELRPGQKDEDSLPPYDLFDAILRLHIDEFKSASDIVDMGYDSEVVRDVLKKVAGAEYKRWQYPIGPKVSPVAYSTDRKIPVAMKK